MGDDRSSKAGDPPRPSTVDVAGLPEAVHFDDEERPARELTGRVGLGVAVVAFAVAVLVLWQVFRPLAQGSQFYLIIFLAGTLPLCFLAYKSGVGKGRDVPSVSDGLLAGAALLVCLHPVNPFAGGY